MQITRRQFLQVGAIPFLGLSLPQYLRIEPDHKKSVIFFFLLGGPSHIDTYDPKPEAPKEIRGPYQTINTNVPGIKLAETLPEQAKIADKLCIIRSFSHQNPNHGAARLFAVSGHDTETTGQFYPSFGSVFSKLRDQQEEGLIDLPYVFLGETFNNYPHGIGNLGLVEVKCKPKFVAANPNHPDFKVSDLELISDISPERLGSRKKVLEQLDNLKLANEKRLVEMDIFQERAFELLTNEKLANAFAIEREKTEVRDRYGNTEIGQKALLARRLVEARVCFVGIDYRPEEKNNYGWDHHIDLERWMPIAAYPFDQAISTLITDLEERGLRDEVLVIAFGEFGRTPKINKYAGRDHWPKAGSVLFAGGGIAGGQVYGTTDKIGGATNFQAVHPPEILATIYKTIGYSPDTRLYDKSKRPVFLAEGRPISI